MQIDPNFRLKTPILMIIFNRSDHALKVIDQIRRVRPMHMYIGGDGPRAEKEGEDIRVEKTRQQVLDAIDWDCEIHTLFQEKNIGCGWGPYYALNWFFDNVDAGIVLEDDCLPSDSFFFFCEHFLDKYFDDERFMMVSGTNLLNRWKEETVDYFYSVRGGTWGWASWKRAWAQYDFTMKHWPNPYIQELIRNFVDTNSWKALEEEYQITYDGYDQNVSTWDYQWNFARLINNGLSIIPSKNLVSNIGFGADATHTFDDSPWNNMPRFEYQFPLQENPIIIPDMDFDQKVHEMIHLKLWNKVSRKLKKISNNVLKQ